MAIHFLPDAKAIFPRFHDVPQILAGAEDNFQKYSHGTIGSFRVPYDYSSIMHYPKDAFAKRPGLATIRAKKPGVTFGQRDHLSSGDVKKITLYYKCSS